MFQRLPQVYTSFPCLWDGTSVMFFAMHNCVAMGIFTGGDLGHVVLAICCLLHRFHCLCFAGSASREMDS